MHKLTINNGKCEWVETSAEEIDAEFRESHDGKSAEELIAENFPQN